MKTLSITIPHSLGATEAKRRIVDAIAEQRSTRGAMLNTVNEKWTENHLDVKANVKGQNITGRLDITDHEAKLEIDLPWMLAMLAGGYRKRAEEEGRKLLS